MLTQVNGNRILRNALFRCNHLIYWREVSMRMPTHVFSISVLAVTMIFSSVVLAAQGSGGTFPCQCIESCASVLDFCKLACQPDDKFCAFNCGLDQVSCDLDCELADPACDNTPPEQVDPVCDAKCKSVTDECILACNGDSSCVTSCNLGRLDCYVECVNESAPEQPTPCTASCDEARLTCLTGCETSEELFCGTRCEMESIDCVDKCAQPNALQEIMGLGSCKGVRR